MSFEDNNDGNGFNSRNIIIIVFVLLFRPQGFTELFNMTGKLQR